MAIVIYKTRNLERIYNVSTTIYTGVASGYDIESREGTRVDWSSVDNGIDNLINIIKSRTTLKNVSMRLYAQSMIYGDSTKDNQYIKAENFKHIYKITPKEVRKLIDKSSVDSTIKNLYGYEQATNVNFVYGLFNWYHPHYSYESLKNIEVTRLSSSDMLEISYRANDPGIAYQTLVLLNEEFIKEYKQLRFGETNNVIEYFRGELRKLGDELKISEDSLVQYNIKNRIINYPEQAKQVSGMDRDFQSRYEEILLNYNSSVALADDLSEKIQEQTAMIQNNRDFIEKLKEISKLSGDITRLESFQSDSLSLNSNWRSIVDLKRRLSQAEKDAKQYSNLITEKRYTKEGIAITEYVSQWLLEVIKREKSAAELKVMEDRRKLLDEQYVFLAPIGTTITRKERNINFQEQAYMNNLASLNSALMRQKNLEMSSASLKALNPPLFPIDPERTARRQMTALSFVGTFMFILGFFVIMELLDRTLRDKARTEKLIPGVTILGAYPKLNKIRFRSYSRDYKVIATNFLANSIIPYLNPKERPDIINILSTDEGAGKSFIMNELKEYWEERDLRIKTLSWNIDLDLDSREFILAQNISDISVFDNEDIIMVEHKPVTTSTIPIGLLQEASLNILVLRADRPWKDIDKVALERIKFNAAPSKIVILLTNANREAAEIFLGLLPPFNKFRSLVYKFIQFGLTAK